MQAEEITGRDVLLVPVAPDRAAAILAGELDGRRAGRGWPHADTQSALSFAGAGGLTWLVVDGDVVVGELGTKEPPNPAGRVEIGYGLAGPSRGRGLGGRAVAALVTWLHAQPEIAMVEARVSPANEASIRLLLRLGFASAGTAGGERVFELPPPPP
jgi:RimJ/RimL family protein N-acetyltransferase